MYDLIAGGGDVNILLYINS